MSAYGGMKSIYTAGPLPIASKDSMVKLAENDGSGVFVLPMVAQAHLPPPMAQAPAPGGPVPAQASSSSATAPPPSLSKVVAYLTRLGYGKFGDVRANQLIVEVAAARDQHHYYGGPFCFFKPTACKPESLMAFLDPVGNIFPGSIFAAPARSELELGAEELRCRRPRFLLEESPSVAPCSRLCLPRV
ncbi:hypothetical protein ACFX13_031604 [Malus domestica]